MRQTVWILRVNDNEGMAHREVETVRRIVGWIEPAGQVRGLINGVGGIWLWMGGEERRERTQKGEYRMSNGEVRFPCRCAPRNDYWAGKWWGG